MGLLKRLLKRLFWTPRKLWAPRKPKMAIIDDASFVRRAIYDRFHDRYDITEFTRIPDFLDELDAFDVLVVDGDGIGNSHFDCGATFLKCYIPVHSEKRFVHYTGLCIYQNKQELKRLGCSVVSKGANPDELERAVTGK